MEAIRRRARRKQREDGCLIWPRMLVRARLRRRRREEEELLCTFLLGGNALNSVGLSFRAWEATDHVSAPLATAAAARWCVLLVPLSPCRLPAPAPTQGLGPPSPGLCRWIVSAGCPSDAVFEKQEGSHSPSLADSVPLCACAAGALLLPAGSACCLPPAEVLPHREQCRPQGAWHAREQTPQRCAAAVQRR